ncbi:hypothetical protein BOX15_Mlig010443g3, partial [Macrostomum lignano]
TRLNLHTARRIDSTQAIMKWQLVLGLLVLAALVVVEPSEAKAESESKEDPSDSDDSKMSEEQFPKLRKKGFHVHFHG